MKKIIFLVIGLIILLIIILFAVQAFMGGRKNNTPSGPVILSYAGLWEEEKLMRPVIEAFQKQNPNIQIQYNRASSQNYRTRTQAQIKEGKGPDVFRIHNTWLSMFQGQGLLAPAPLDVFNMQEYNSTFYPIADRSFVKDNRIYAAPMEIDGLAMYYNEDILAAGGVTAVPTTWPQFANTAVALTVIDANRNIQTSGAALGWTGNIDHWSDIVGLLLLQSGVDFEEPLTSREAVEVFGFYSKFVNNPLEPNKVTWSKDMPSSTEAFAQGKVAFYFAPSWRAHELRQRNPNLKFKIAPVPQLDPNNPIGWGSFWAETVSVTSQHQAEAWKFVKFLTSTEAQKLLYQEASKVRLFGEPYSRVDLQKEIVNDPLVGAYVKQGPIYRSWYLSSNTFDNGLNDKIIKYFEDGINDTVNGKDPAVLLQTVDAGVKQVFAEINATPAPSASGQTR